MLVPRLVQTGEGILQAVGGKGGGAALIGRGLHGRYTLDASEGGGLGAELFGAWLLEQWTVALTE